MRATWKAASRGLVSRLSLSQRVFASSAAAVLLVVALFAAVAHHSLQRVASRWAREDLAALGHHVAEVVLASPPEERRQVIARLAEHLLAFDVVITVADEVIRSSDGSSLFLPLGPGLGELRLRRSRPAEVELSRRLTRLNLFLGGAALAALLAAVQSSVYWGLVRPLREVRNQLRLMRRGPWRVPASAAIAAPELAELSRDVEEVGAILDQKVSEWVAAERRAAEQLTSSRLRTATLPSVRSINLIASDLLARGALDDRQVRSLREIVRAGEGLLATLSSGDKATGQDPNGGRRQPHARRHENAVGDAEARAPGPGKEAP
jgi:hypothetical protein